MPVKGDASRRDRRETVLDDWLERRIHVERSLRQMVKAGHRWAMVPAELCPADLDRILRRLDQGVDAPLVCGVILHEDGAAWVCLAAFDRDRPSCFQTDGHAWPDADARLAALGGLLEQVDPIARIERRVAAALGEPSDHPLVAAFAGDMPVA